MNVTTKNKQHMCNITLGKRLINRIKLKQSPGYHDLENEIGKLQVSSILYFVLKLYEILTYFSR